MNWNHPFGGSTARRRQANRTTFDNFVWLTILDPISAHLKTTLCYTTQSYSNCEEGSS